MATYSSSLRSGLPRVPGGEPWPPEGAIGEPVEPGTSFEPEAIDSGAEVDEPVASEVPTEAASDSKGSDSVVETSAESDADSAADPQQRSAAETTSEVPLRRGLARVEGGDPWPPEGLAPEGVKATSDSTSSLSSGSVSTVSDTQPEAEAETQPESDSSPVVATAAVATAGAGNAGDVPLRRGLPRVAGGEPWPPEGLAPAGTKAGSATSAVEFEPDTSTSVAEEIPEASEAGSSAAAPAAAVAVGAAAASSTGGQESSGALSDTPLRRGLPRVAGGDPWPPEGFAPASAGVTAASIDAASPATADSATVSEEKTSAENSAQPDSKTSAGTDASSAAPASAKSDEPAQDSSTAAASSAPKPTRSGLRKSTGPAQKKPTAKPAAKSTDKPTAKPAAKPAAKPTAKPAAKASPAPTKTAPASSPAAAKSSASKKKEPMMIGSRPLGQWAKLGGLGLGGLIVVGGILVLAARGLTTLPGVTEFLERYPGEYDLPEFVDDGFPAWARWTHFLNVFFIVLIIRSGLQVRHQQKPPAFYTPKKGGKKISINLWFHTGLDLLWLANGVIFVVLLFVSGHWARIVPTSWEVFPNALSAMLQYMMMDWPAEDGWVNYNSLQQLMYFLIVFVAAPLAAITGLRMSEWWPKDATKLNKIYPAPLARAIHFPTMIFFVVFILIHVFLVLVTGMRQNLNHMFAGSDALNWVGFIWFVVSLAVIAGGWFAARPMLLAPIANMFGRVSSR